LGIKNPEERAFYEIEATNEGWSLREIRRQFDSGLYERLALSRDKASILALAGAVCRWLRIRLLPAMSTSCMER
jgi:predicted nuclease of restriction endonuclease-like (RecB) superfamily